MFAQIIGSDGPSESFKSQVDSKRVNTALCGQFHGEGCAVDMGLCDKKSGYDWLFRWVEARTYGGYFPDPILPIEACEHDPDDKWAWLCLNCLAHNTEASTKCQDCRVRRGTDAEGIACADGADCSSCRCDQLTLNGLSTHSQLTLN